MDFKPLITLLAIVNPLAIVPFFIHYTQDFTLDQRRRTIWIASLSTFVVIATSALMGLHILDFFGISLASFQVGGGMLLLTSALSMLNAQPAEAKSNEEEMHDAAARASIAVVPLTIPLLTGPATMSTVVIYSEKAKNSAATRHSGGLWPGGGGCNSLVFLSGAAHRERPGQNGHQRDDPSDGPDSGGVGRGGDVRRTGHAVSRYWASSRRPARSILTTIFPNHVTVGVMGRTSGRVSCQRFRVKIAHPISIRTDSCSVARPKLLPL